MPEEDPVLSALVAHWADLRSRQSSEVLATLTWLVRRLSGAPTDVARVTARNDLITFLRDNLPASHEIRAVIRNAPSRSDVRTVDQDAAIVALERALSESPDTEHERAVAVAKRALLEEGAYTAEQVREHQGDPDQPRLLRLSDDGETVFPAFQFGRDGVPHPIVLVINDLLGAAADPWGVADWWLRENSRIGAVPVTLIGRVPDDELLATARALLEED